MSIQLITFFALSLLAIGGAVFMLNLERIVHMVIALAFTFLSLAGLYVPLQAEFIAFAQVMVYSGAITILMLYGIMMTKHDVQENEGGRRGHKVWSLVAVAGLFVLLIAGIFHAPWPAPGEVALAEDNTAAIGKALFTEYVIPFELASVLLLVALVGAIVLAKREEGDEA